MGATLKKYSILYVDDEPENLTGFKFLFRRYYRVLLANSGEEALELLKENEVHLVLADQRMPNMTGASLLAKVAQLYPEINRVIVTGYSDIEGVVEAVNKGGIYYYVTKPWNAEELKMIIDRALESYQLRHDKKKLIDDLKASNKELDTFLYRSAHDLRRPLTTMLGLTQLADFTVKDPNAIDLFHKVEETAKGMNALLSKLYMVNDINLKEEDGEESDTNLPQMIEDIWAELEELKGGREKIYIKVGNDVQTFRCNPVLLHNILFNLIENSIVFQDSSRMLELDVQARYEDGQVLIQVSDNGIGIHPKFLSEVFEMYFVASESTNGNGLGLYVVKRSAEQMGGSVMLTSEEGKGTTVSLRIPLKA